MKREPKRTMDAGDFQPFTPAQWHRMAFRVRYEALSKKRRAIVERVYQASRTAMIDGQSIAAHIPTLAVPKLDQLVIDCLTHLYRSAGWDRLHHLSGPGDDDTLAFFDSPRGT